MRGSPLDTAPIVRRIFDLSEAGNGMTDITRTLDKGGIASPRGRQWGKTNVHTILLMTSRAPKIANPRRVGSPFLLSGLVKCKTYRRDHRGFRPASVESPEGRSS